MDALQGSPKPILCPLCCDPLKRVWEKSPRWDTFERVFPKDAELLSTIEGNCVNKACPIGEIKMKFDFKPVEKPEAKSG